MIVYRPCMPSYLGNNWAACHWLLHESIKRNDVIRMTRVENDHSEEYLSLINSPGRIILVPDPPTVRMDDFLGENLWSTPYFPTHERWLPSGRTVCYQFDGRTRPEKTNPSATDADTILGAMTTAGYEVIRLGLPLSASESVHRLATCSAFIGSDSGISHLAHSVGCPTFLLEYTHPLTQAHPNKIYTPCFGAQDTITKVLEFLK